jgi:rhodanese-related sulfurtransferase
MLLAPDQTMELAKDHEGRVRTVDAELLLQELRSGWRIVILDIRTGSAARGHADRIPGSHAVPMNLLVAHCRALVSHRSEPVVVVSEHGRASRRAALELEQAGFTEVRSLEGGIAEWSRHGFPLTPTPTTFAWDAAAVRVRH